MKLAISNIAWDISEDIAIADLLKKHEIKAIDVAPGKYFPDPIKATTDDIVKVKTWWGNQGIEINGMQALLFGTQGLNLFGTAEVQSTMLTHLDAICRIGNILGARRLVFGSPRNRDRSGLTDQETEEFAVSFFNRLGNIAQAHNVIICLEPNPICYGANFMINTLETAKIVELVNHSSIKMQLDTGAMIINNEDIEQVLPRVANLIGHIHISEPDLVPIGDKKTAHTHISSCITKLIPNLVATIEMLATKEESHPISIERALNFTINNYCQSQGVTE